MSSYQSILDSMFDARFGPAKTRAAMQSAIDQGVSYTQSVCKVDTGYLKSKVTGRVIDDTTGQFESGAEYAVHVNYGTYKMTGDQHFDKGIAVIEKALKENLSKL